MPEISGQGNAVLLSLIKNNIMVVNSPLIRRKVVDVVGLFDPDLTPVEDWEYWIRCAAKGLNFQFQELVDAGALVRAHEMSSSLNQRRFLRAVLNMRQKLARMDLGPEVLKLNQLRIAEEQGHLGVEEYVDGQHRSGIRQMLRAAMVDPRLRFKAKWLICALSAPFVSKDQLKQMVTSSLTGSISGAAHSGN